MFAEANLANRHHVLNPSIVWEHTQHCEFVDWHGSKAADNIDREDGTKMSWTEALASLDSATAIPTCGSEEAVAQELQQDDPCHVWCWSSLLLRTTVMRFLSLCCVRPGFEIAHDLEQYTGAALPLVKEAFCLMFPRFELQLVDQHSEILQAAEAVQVVP